MYCYVPIYFQLLSIFHEVSYTINHFRSLPFLKMTFSNCIICQSHLAPTCLSPINSFLNSIISHKFISTNYLFTSLLSVPPSTLPHLTDSSHSLYLENEVDENMSTNIFSQSFRWVDVVVAWDWLDHLPHS